MTTLADMKRLAEGATAETILKMIETVKPDDTAKLDEIDARVTCLLDNRLFCGMANAGLHYYNLMYPLSMAHPKRAASGKYTRSRDALKAIRPDGYTCMASMVVPSCRFVGYVWKGDKETRTLCPSLPTEELAELHAIIQALEHERTTK